MKSNYALNVNKLIPSNEKKWTSLLKNLLVCYNSRTFVNLIFFFIKTAIFAKIPAPIVRQVENQCESHSSKNECFSSKIKKSYTISLSQLNILLP